MLNSFTLWGWLAGLCVACVVQLHHDSQWGKYNHANGRAWSWRPTWKTDFKK